ncbi:hypothetical protein NPIL_528261 [Nephila pilipes]|uniref:Uncharacterized protein n=1 Tax=Nephila pilipes TaxID=299642 RepID=A0A8X6R3A9_NEPPI|nr:hypothetical protein NPIL_528261 [Nephila pilipes]
MDENYAERKMSECEQSFLPEDNNSSRTFRTPDAQNPLAKDEFLVDLDSDELSTDGEGTEEELTISLRNKSTPLQMFLVETLADIGNTYRKHEGMFYFHLMSHTYVRNLKSVDMNVNGIELITMSHEYKHVKEMNKSLKRTIKSIRRADEYKLFYFLQNLGKHFTENDIDAMDDIATFLKLYFFAPLFMDKLETLNAFDKTYLLKYRDKLVETRAAILSRLGEESEPNLLHVSHTKRVEFSHYTKQCEVQSHSNFSLAYLHDSAQARAAYMIHKDMFPDEYYSYASSSRNSGTRPIDSVDSSSANKIMPDDTELNTSPNGTASCNIDMLNTDVQGKFRSEAKFGESPTTENLTRSRLTQISNRSRFFNETLNWINIMSTILGILKQLYLDSSFRVRLLTLDVEAMTREDASKIGEYIEARITHQCIKNVIVYVKETSGKLLDKVIFYLVELCVESDMEEVFVGILKIFLWFPIFSKRLFEFVEDDDKYIEFHATRLYSSRDGVVHLQRFYTYHMKNFQTALI